MLIHINFSFDFLGLDNVDLENYFANKLKKMQESTVENQQKNRKTNNQNNNMNDQKKNLIENEVQDEKNENTYASHFISDKALLRVL